MAALEKSSLADTSHTFPEGLNAGHADSRPVTLRYANIVSLVILGGIVLAALLGVFGGGRSRTMAVTTQDAALSIKTPTTMRSGIFFETVVRVTARRAIGDVVISLPAALWRDQTINTSIPQADKEEGKNGSFLFHYGQLKAGETLEIKYDGQINPPLFAGTKGSIALLDGDRPLAAVPLSYRVWP